MPTYEVSVPFSRLTYEAWENSTKHVIPDSFDLPNMKVTRGIEEKTEEETTSLHIYIAKLQQEASDTQEAEKNAVARVEEFLELAAAMGDGFQIISSGVETTWIASEPDTSTRTISRRTKAAIVRKRDVTFEHDALLLREQWRECPWLRTALTLNYLALVSQHIAPALIILHAALEAITNGVLGEPQTVLKTEFQDKKVYEEVKQQLRGEIKKVLSDFGLSKDAIDRLVGYMLTAHMQSPTDRITKVLDDNGIEVKREDVDFVRQQRNIAAHGKRPSNDDDLNRAARLAQNWVQNALQAIIRNQKWPST